MRTHDTMLDTLEEELCILHIDRVDQMREGRRALSAIAGNEYLPKDFFDRSVDRYSTHQLEMKAGVLEDLLASNKLPENAARQVAEAEAALQQLRSSAMAVERLHIKIKPHLPESQTLAEFDHMAVTRATEVRNLMAEKGYAARVGAPTVKPAAEAVAVLEPRVAVKAEATIAETAKAIEAEKGIFPTIGKLAKEHWGKATALGVVLVVTAAALVWNGGKAREQQLQRRDNDSPDQSRQ